MQPMMCSSVGCSNTHNSMGWCKRHYDTARRAGILHMGTPRKAISQQERIFRYSQPRMPDGCWVWIGGLNRKGYGTIRGSATRFAHRAAYETFIGAIPQGYVIDHTCENRACVNPLHLEATTPRRNIAFRSTKALASWWSENLVPVTFSTNGVGTPDCAR